MTGRTEPGENEHREVREASTQKESPAREREARAAGTIDMRKERGLPRAQGSGSWEMSRNQGHEDVPLLEIRMEACTELPQGRAHSGTCVVVSETAWLACSLSCPGATSAPGVAQLCLGGASVTLPCVNTSFHCPHIKQKT